MKDVFDKCKTDGGYFGKMRHAGDHYFSRPTLDPYPGPRMNFQGKEVIMWSVNNYLGLAGDDDIRQSAVDAAQEYSVSAPMGSRMMSGTTEHHLALEKALADVAQKEAAYLFNYGYLGVLGTVASLIEPDDVIVMDKLAHACIVDSAFLSRGQLRVYRHNDMNSLESTLKHVNRNRKGGVMILTEGVYGMTGDLAKLDDIAELKEKYEARVFVDDAHGWGVLGEKGRGTADYFGVQDKIDIYFGTFAKSFASIGGFSASTQSVIDWITYNARTQVFAKALPMVYVKSLQKTLEKVVAGDDLRATVWERSNQLKSGLRDLGFYIGEGHSPICSVFAPTGDAAPEEIGVGMVTYLRERGIFVSGIVYPVIPLGLMMFRMIPTTAHSEEDVETTIKGFADMKKDLNLDLTMVEKDKQNLEKIFGKDVR